MLKSKRIALIGGDERYLQIINHLAEKNAELYIDGFTEIEFQHTNIHHYQTDKIKFNQIDAIVLPVLGMDAKGQINLHYPEEKKTLTEQMINETPNHCVIYTGTANDYLIDLAKKCNRELIILFERDDIAILNSIPTAEATLQIAMEKTKFTIHGANILITGFGRIGITIARLFHQVGAHVTVAARKQADFARIREMRMHPIHTNQLNNAVEHNDICVNTVPQLLFTKDIVKLMKKDTLIIDVASKPGGTDFDATEEKGIKAIHALGLPGSVAPKTAGNIIAHTIAELVSGGG